MFHTLAAGEQRVTVRILQRQDRGLKSGDLLVDIWNIARPTTTVLRRERRNRHHQDYTKRKSRVI